MKNISITFIEDKVRKTETKKLKNKNRNKLKQ